MLLASLPDSKDPLARRLDLRLIPYGPRCSILSPGYVLAEQILGVFKGVLSDGSKEDVRE